MRTVLLNLTASLDGFIADEDGGIDWLLPPPKEVPREYLELIEPIDTLIMGRATYETSLALEGGTEIFSGKTVYVFTRRSDLVAQADVQLVRDDPVAFTERLKKSEGGWIWMFGGGEMASLLSEAGLIDEYLVAIQPILLGKGIPLWRRHGGPTRLDPVSARTWSDGIVELRYRRRQDAR